MRDDRRKMVKNSEKGGSIPLVERERRFVVGDEVDDGSVRIDQFLMKKFADNNDELPVGESLAFSRTYFSKLASDGFVFVNGRGVNKSFKVKQGDEVIVRFPKPAVFDVEPKDIAFDIFDIQDDFFVINKPAGLTVHHTKVQSKDPNLVAGLLYRFKELRDFGDDERPGIVHRLDKNTSGLLLVARNMLTQAQFSKMFKDRLVKKTYLAVVKGHPEKEGRIELPIGRHPAERNKMSHVSYAGRPALTFYKVLEYYADSSLVEVKIVTGRTHQIRVHFAAIGHGLLGDSMYGHSSKLISRQALHAWKLSFNFRGRLFEYCCPVPEDFRHLLYNLRFRLT